MRLMRNGEEETLFTCDLRTKQWKQNAGGYATDPKQANVRSIRLGVLPISGVNVLMPDSEKHLLETVKWHRLGISQCGIRFLPSYTTDLFFSMMQYATASSTFRMQNVTTKTISCFMFYLCANWKMHFRFEMTDIPLIDGHHSKSKIRNNPNRKKT